jgi:hypothetical protein
VANRQHCLSFDCTKAAFGCKRFGHESGDLERLLERPNDKTGMTKQVPIGFFGWVNISLMQSGAAV